MNAALGSTFADLYREFLPRDIRNTDMVREYLRMMRSSNGIGALLVASFISGIFTTLTYAVFAAIGAFATVQMSFKNALR